MKKSITLALNNERLMEIQRILLDDNTEAALRFLETCLDINVRAIISGEGH